MHKTSAEAEQLATGIVKGMAHVGGVEVILCPPFPYLALVGKIVSGSTIALGGQNMYPEKEGAFTGEVSPSMLLDVGCKFVILGHSERRHTMGETDTFINQKVRLALDCGLDMILCVGETMAERTAHQTELVIVSIAYEPVWAIGNASHHATPQQAEDAHRVLRTRFGNIFGSKAAANVVIQYGGSVVPDNAEAFLCRPGVDGALIGGASLKADDFLAILRAAATQQPNQ
jgi:triosephosphate isomerase